MLTRGLTNDIMKINDIFTKGGEKLASLDKQEVELVEQAVVACAAEQEDQLTGRKLSKNLMEWIYAQVKAGIPMYTILVALWVTIVQLSEEWRDHIGQRITD